MNLRIVLKYRYELRTFISIKNVTEYLIALDPRSNPAERVPRTSGTAQKDLVHKVRSPLDRPLQMQLRIRKHIHG